MTVREAFEKLTRNPQTEDDLVVCHGDYCFPNVLVEGDRVTSWLDVGELGVASRWLDLAVATWTCTWNVGPGYEERFLKEYGETLDAEKCAWYRLLYDMVSYVFQKGVLDNQYIKGMMDGMLSAHVAREAPSR